MEDGYHVKVNITGKTLTLYRGDEKVASYPVIAGRNSSEGTKEQSGDQRTPRGRYRVCTINEQSKFTLFFGLDYPGEKDAGTALIHNAVSADEYVGIMKSHQEGKRPPWDTSLGGEIGIHGGGIDRDGTRGCIAMKDKDVLSLKHYLKIGTIVDIDY